MLAGAASAALLTLATPASGAGYPSTGSTSSVTANAVSGSVETFYAHQNGAVLWLPDGADSAAARELIGVLSTAGIDGMASGPALAAQANALLARARSGDPAALKNAERLLSNAWVMYVRNLQRAPDGMAIADGWAAPRQQGPIEILQRAAAANSLVAHVRSTSAVNPIYAELRQAAMASGGASDPRVLANLARVRAMPFQSRYVMVDAGSAKLWMVENGQIVDSMKVIVGKASSPTPMLASTIYRATVNPYWNVPEDLVQKLIAPRVVDQGVSYLKNFGYEVLSGYGADAQPIPASSVDWKAVAAGQTVVKVRQLPGPGNSMGQVKFGFPNANDVFLHDTPKKDLFAQASRDLSNGCIRLEDAEKLSRWLLGSAPVATSSAPEQHVLLPKPVPIYVTYLTARAEGGQLSFAKDVYGRDGRDGSTAIASLR